MHDRVMKKSMTLSGEPEEGQKNRQFPFSRTGAASGAKSG